MIAGSCSIPEVCIQFGGRLLRGNRATKTTAYALKAFDSPNHPRLGRTGVAIEISDDLVRRPPRGNLEVRPIGKAKVGALRLFPGTSDELLENILLPPLEGLVLECYGVGNAPVHNGRLVEIIEEATSRDVVIGVCSQCSEGRVDLGGYATGSALRNAGAISGLDMTAEAMMTKMMYLLDRGYPVAEVKAKIQQSLRGELSPPRLES